MLMGIFSTYPIPCLGYFFLWNKKLIMQRDLHRCTTPVLV